MDPIAVLTLAVTLGEKFCQLLGIACKKLSKRCRSSSSSTSSSSSCWLEPLQKDLSRLCDSLDYLKSAAALGSRSHALETLLEELSSSVQHFNKLLPNSPHEINARLANRDFEQYQQRFMTEFREKVASAILEVEKRCEMQRTVSDKYVDTIKTKTPQSQMVTVLITFIVQKEALENPMLMEALSFVQDMAFPTDTFQILFNKVLAFEQHDCLLPLLQAPELEQKGTMEVMVPDKSGMMMKEEVGVNTPKMEKARQIAASDKEEQVVLYNPNRNLELVTEKGEGAVDVFECEGTQWRVKYQNPSLAVRVVSGKRPMEVSAELGFFYYEVTLMEMAEKEYSSNPGRYAHLEQRNLKPGRAGVGVGLACHWVADKVAGWYKHSYGYDGRVGNYAYCEGRAHYLNTGSFRVGDTVGIGLFTQHGGSPFVFLTKNGAFQDHMSNARLTKKLADCLYPMISLVSLDVEVLVNFHGPFLYTSFDDLATKAANASR